VRREIVQRCQWVRDHGSYGGQGAADMAEEVLQRLVWVYADRPDFPPEWLPEVPW